VPGPAIIFLKGMGTRGKRQREGGKATTSGAPRRLRPGGAV